MGAGPTCRYLCNVGNKKDKAKTKDNKRDNVSFEEIVKCGHCPRQWMLSTFSLVKLGLRWSKVQSQLGFMTSCL
jgi:hypothetical protein